MEVCSLSRGTMSLFAQSLSGPLQPGLRFFHHLLPAVLSVGLTVHFPLRENYGFTMFRLYAVGRVRCLLVRR